MQNNNLDLGNKVSDSRKKMGLSQEALAEKANVSLSTIQRIEKGVVKPRSFTLKILAKTLELDPSELLSHLIENKAPKSSSPALKRMNLYTILLVFIPFVNMIIPFTFWKKNKAILSKDVIAGKMMSFQLLWSLFTIIGMLISVFLSNMITGQAGLGLYVLNTVYLLAVTFNILVIIKTATQLNNEDEKTLSFVPNLF